ncbi:MAG: PQQ-dependent dehydrogenase, methanol/ethanol family [Pseudomonadota bacterium]
MIDSNRFKKVRSLTYSASLLTLVAIASATTTMPTQASITEEAAGDAGGPALRALRNADDQSGQWRLTGRDFGEQRFSPLDQITVENIGKLALDWFLDLPRDGGQEATPLMIDEHLYFTTAWNRVYAVNARSGALVWTYDPDVPRATQVKGCCGPVSRGLAYYGDRLLVATFDGRLIALNLKDGAQLWSVNTLEGAVSYSPSESYTITGAPRIAGDKVVIGNGGAEYGVRGFVSAFDIATGELAWRFYTIPGDPSKPFENPILEMAAKTWNGEWWKVGGGGTVWDHMAYDPESGLLYIGVGNASPWNPNIRSDGKGDNLFVSSIVALKADTGEYVWHYQTTPGDGWDYTATQHMILADLPWQGETRKLLLQAPKNGFFYLLDRITGELLSAEAYSKVTWATHVDIKSGRPAIRESSKYWLTGKTAVQYPSAGGAHNWHPMAYSPDSGLIYIPTVEFQGAYTPNDDEVFAAMGRNTGMAYGALDFPKDPQKLAAIDATVSGALVAWDPVRGEPRWRFKQRYPHAGGVLATAGGLVFQGEVDGRFMAIDAESGDELWNFDAQTSVKAAPITYRIDGKQYIAVLVGRGGQLYGGRTTGDVTRDIVNRSRLLVFSLDGEAALPAPNEPKQQMADLRSIEAEPTRVATGSLLYQKHCVSCHGISAVSNSVVPDLRYSGFLATSAGWISVVRDGVLESQGMAGFEPLLDREQTEDIRHYVLSKNHISQQFGDTTRVGR